MTDASDRRGVLARIGISALNLVLPGLGLLRLARYRAAGVFFLLLLVSMAVLLGGYCLIEQIRFGEWTAIVGMVLALTLIACLGSIAASWRASKLLEARAGKAWRWYGILAVWVVSVMATWLVGDAAHARYHGFYTPGEAMLPTMHVDDRFLADMHGIDPISRGDVVIVRANGVDYVKRVAALPGDRIALAGGTVILNGKPIAQHVTGTTRFKADWGEQGATVSREQFPGEAKPHLVMDTGPGLLDDVSEITLPPDRYFLLGDNRDHSSDSRLPPGVDAGLGLVARDAITGRVAFRYWRDGAGVGPGKD